MDRKIAPKLLFLCTGNSCRSQMAEGWARELHGDRFAIYSAGIEAHGMNARAVAAMELYGIDISGQSSKRISELPEVDFDWLITVCDHAQEKCPTFSGACRQIHHAFDDPPSITPRDEGEVAALEPYLRVCGQIRDWVRDLPKHLEQAARETESGKEQSKNGSTVLA